MTTSVTAVVFAKYHGFTPIYETLSLITVMPQLYNIPTCLVVGWTASPEKVWLPHTGVASAAVSGAYFVVSGRVGARDGISAGTMSSNVTVRTRKFIRNALLARRQMVSPLKHFDFCKIVYSGFADSVFQGWLRLVAARPLALDPSPFPSM